jgi:hypothetical protein
LKVPSRDSCSCLSIHRANPLSSRQWVTSWHSSMNWSPFLTTSSPRPCTCSGGPLASLNCRGGAVAG